MYTKHIMETHELKELWKIRAVFVNVCIYIVIITLYLLILTLFIESKIKKLIYV